LTINLSYQGAGEDWEPLTSGFVPVDGDGCLSIWKYLTVDADEGDAIIFRIIKDNIWKADDVWYLWENQLYWSEAFWNNGGVCPPDAYNIDYSMSYSCGIEDVHAIANSIQFYPMLNRRLTDMDILQEGGMKEKRT
jgi:hypothetical protein